MIATAGFFVDVLFGDNRCCKVDCCVVAFTVVVVVVVVTVLFL